MLSSWRKASIAEAIPRTVSLASIAAYAWASIHVDTQHVASAQRQIRLRHPTTTLRLATLAPTSSAYLGTIALSVESGFSLLRGNTHGSKVPWTPPFRRAPGQHAGE